MYVNLYSIKSYTCHVQFCNSYKSVKNDMFNTVCEKRFGTWESKMDIRKSPDFITALNTEYVCKHILPTFHISWSNTTETAQSEREPISRWFHLRLKRHASKLAWVRTNYPWLVVLLPGIHVQIHICFILSPCVLGACGWLVPVWSTPFIFGNYSADEWIMSVYLQISECTHTRCHRPV